MNAPIEAKKSPEVKPWVRRGVEAAGVFIPTNADGERLGWWGVEMARFLKFCKTLPAETALRSAMEGYGRYLKSSVPPPQDWQLEQAREALRCFQKGTENWHIAQPDAQEQVGYFAGASVESGVGGRDSIPGGKLDVSSGLGHVQCDMADHSPLPPNPIAAQMARSDDPVHHATAKILARYLDEVLRIPGTNIRFGLDPILALFPGIGDLLVSGAGGVILLEALRSGVSISVFLRMAANMGLNFLLGLIPGAGAFLTAFYKSNARNFAILSAWQAGQHGQVKQSTARFFFGLLLLIGMLTGFVALIYLIYGYLFYTAVKSLLP